MVFKVLHIFQFFPFFIKIFTGNRDSSSIIKHIFTTPLKAKKIRFYPVEKNKAHALRVEIYGVNIQGMTVCTFYIYKVPLVF